MAESVREVFIKRIQGADQKGSVPIPSLIKISSSKADGVDETLSLGVRRETQCHAAFRCEFDSRLPRNSQIATNPRIRSWSSTGDDWRHPRRMIVKTACQSGVALRLPPQSKVHDPSFSPASSLRWMNWNTRLITMKSIVIKEPAIRGTRPSSQGMNQPQAIPEFGGFLMDHRAE